MGVVTGGREWGDRGEELRVGVDLVYVFLCVADHCLRVQLRIRRVNSIV